MVVFGTETREFPAADICLCERTVLTISFYFKEAFFFQITQNIGEPEPELKFCIVIICCWRFYKYLNTHFSRLYLLQTPGYGKTILSQSEGFVRGSNQPASSQIGKIFKRSIFLADAKHFWKQEPCDEQENPNTRDTEKSRGACCKIHDILSHDNPFFVLME